MKVNFCNQYITLDPKVGVTGFHHRLKAQFNGAQLERIPLILPFPFTKNPWQDHLAFRSLHLTINWNFYWFFFGGGGELTTLHVPHPYRLQPRRYSPTATYSKSRKPQNCILSFRVVTFALFSQPQLVLTSISFNTEPHCIEIYSTPKSPLPSCSPSVLPLRLSLYLALATQSHSILSAFLTKLNLAFSFHFLPFPLSPFTFMPLQFPLVVPSWIPSSRPRPPARL